MTESMHVRTEQGSRQTFRYSEPIHAITKPGFNGAFWGSVDPKPIGTIPARGAVQNVEVFGFQALRKQGDQAASIEMHPELRQTELTYMIRGDMDMVIQVPDEHAVVSHMINVVPPEVDLHEAEFEFDTNGELIIRLPNGSEFISIPTVTPVGACHETTPLTDECIYLAVKAVQKQ